VPPLKTVISGTYTTPKFGLENNGWQKYLSLIVKDWQTGVVLQYQSGSLIQVPSSNNALTTQLFLSVPAGAATNPLNRVPGSALLVPNFDVNGNLSGGPFDPRGCAVPTASIATGTVAPCANLSTTSVLAGDSRTPTATLPSGCAYASCAWTQPAAGQWGTSAQFLNSFRWRRRPSEALNIGRNFRFGKENRFVLNVRAEFQNILNRMFYSTPSTGGVTGTTGLTFNQGGYTYAGGAFGGSYGVINTFNGAGSSPRTGTLVGRLTF
jgi:hypothetical protein